MISHTLGRRGRDASLVPLGGDATTMTGRSPVSAETSRHLWDAASGQFDPVALRVAIVSRGWTVAEFASVAGISRACLYNVLRRHAASDRTAVRIAATLATREPLLALATP